MESNVTPADYIESRPERLNRGSEAHSSGVSWGAVIGGAFVAAAFYLILLALGAGFGLSAAASMVGRAAQLGALSETSGTATGAMDPNGHFVDTLFRSDRPGPESKDASVQAEAGRIFANALRQNQMPTADQTYLARLVAARTGISQSEAEKTGF